MTAVMYGAGKIGRGFIAQLFYQSGYHTVFVDIDSRVIDDVNLAGEYPVRIVYNDGYHEQMVRDMHGINAVDTNSVAEAIANADVMATAVGVNSLKDIAQTVARGLSLRWQNGVETPLNIIICENMIDSDVYLKQLVSRHLTPDEQYFLNQRTGFVVASIGRTVPLQTPEMRGGNALRICTEAYDTLLVDAAGIKGETPRIKNLRCHTPFSYYIQSKLFMHNMGHCMTAYLGYVQGEQYIYRAISDRLIREKVRRAMKQSAAAICKKHSTSTQELERYAEDLLIRFGNAALGDTVARVGNDLRRKLSRNDRFIGAINLCEEMQLPYDAIIEGVKAALNFDIDSVAKMPRESILTEICGIAKDCELYRKLI